MRDYYQIIERTADLLRTVEETIPHDIDSEHVMGHIYFDASAESGDIDKDDIAIQKSPVDFSYNIPPIAKSDLDKVYSIHKQYYHSSGGFGMEPPETELIKEELVGYPGLEEWAKKYGINIVKKSDYQVLVKVPKEIFPKEDPSRRPFKFDVGDKIWLHGSEYEITGRGRGYSDNVYHVRNQRHHTDAFESQIPEQP